MREPLNTLTARAGETVEHGGHENVVARAIDERDVADEFPLAVCARLVRRSRPSLHFVLALGVAVLADGQNDPLLVVEERRAPERPIIALPQRRRH